MARQRSCRRFASRLGYPRTPPAAGGARNLQGVRTCGWRDRGLRAEAASGRQATGLHPRRAAAARRRACVQRQQAGDGARNRQAASSHRVGHWTDGARLVLGAALDGGPARWGRRRTASSPSGGQLRPSGERVRGLRRTAGSRRRASLGQRARTRTRQPALAASGERAAGGQRAGGDLQENEEATAWEGRLENRPVKASDNRASRAKPGETGSGRPRRRKEPFSRSFEI